jgi:hypothetical protein
LPLIYPSHDSSDTFNLPEGLTHHFSSEEKKRTVNPEFHTQIKYPLGVKVKLTNSQMKVQFKNKQANKQTKTRRCLLSICKGLEKMT